MNHYGYCDPLKNKSTCIDELEILYGGGILALVEIWQIQKKTKSYAHNDQSENKVLIWHS